MSIQRLIDSKCCIYADSDWIVLDAYSNYSLISPKFKGLTLVDWIELHFNERLEILDDKRRKSESKNLVYLVRSQNALDIFQKTGLPQADLFSTALEKFKPFSAFCEDSDLERALNLRRNLLSSVTNAFRVVQRGELSQFDVAIDLYADYLCFWVFEEDAIESSMLEKARFLYEQISRSYSCKGAVVKFSQKNPHKKGLIQKQKILGEEPPAWFEVFEHDLKLRVTLTQMQHTGLFLDQRDNRRRVFLSSKNKKVANLFCFSGSLTIAALAGSATLTSSVDLSQKYLDWTKENLALNGLLEKTSPLICEDARTWLLRQGRRVERDLNQSFDIIICDPPTFASSGKKHKNFNVEKEWDNLASLCKKIASPNSQIYFSTNCQKQSSLFFEKPLRQYFKSIKPLPTPFDFSTSQNHLKSFFAINY